MLKNRFSEVFIPDSLETESVLLPEAFFKQGHR